jgi:serine/threonine-protein kinase
MKIGDRISEYVLAELLGMGSFGQVWRANHHVWIDHVVAVKIPTDPQYVRNLQREGSAIHRLHHPNIARALGFDPFNDPPYLVTEYVPGMNLRQLIKRGTLSAIDSMLIMKQVLAGLDHAHSRGIVHRDIKPENILVHERASADGYGAEGMIKVTDFGLGKAAAQTAADSIVYSSSLDKSKNEIAGSLEYMAPEQRDGSPIDARADLYACGVVLFEMLTGQRPAGTEVPSDRNPSAPKHLDEVFRRAYARLDKRFTSAKEFSAMLSAGTPPPLPKIIPIAAAETGKSNCLYCHRQIDKQDQFCMHCGMQLVAHVRRCIRCGGYPHPGDKYCLFCGVVLNPAAAG